MGRVPSLVLLVLCVGSLAHRHLRQAAAPSNVQVGCDGKFVCPDGPCQPPVKRPRHDCFVGSKPHCVNAYSEDTICRGARGNSTKSWMSMDCDYVVEVVPAQRPENADKWAIVVHGGCDRGALSITEWIFNSLQVSYYGFRPCAALSPPCQTQNMTTCDTLHLSWAGNDTTTGFNEPELERIYHNYLENDRAAMLWVHEYDEDDSDYALWSKLPCILTGQPNYVCIGGDNAKGNFEDKFKRMAAQFALMSHSSHVQCEVIAIDSRNRSAKSTEVCSNVYFSSAVTDIHWELSYYLSRALGLAIMDAPPSNPGALNTLIPLREAARIALEGLHEK